MTHKHQFILSITQDQGADLFHLGASNCAVCGVPPPRQIAVSADGRGPVVSDRLVAWAREVIASVEANR